LFFALRQPIDAVGHKSFLRTLLIQQLQQRYQTSSNMSMSLTRTVLRTQARLAAKKLGSTRSSSSRLAAPISSSSIQEQQYCIAPNQDYHYSSTNNNLRYFSATPSITLATNFEKPTPLSALDMSVVRQIKAELMSVDENSDGRLQADELKLLLRKHSTAFTDEEIMEISDLYYAGKAGGAVTFDNFIEAVDYAARNDESKKDTSTSGVWTQQDKMEHFKETGRHPLGVGRDGVEFMHAGKSHGHYTAEELDVKLTHVQPKGIRDNLAYGAVRLVRVLFDTATGWRNDNIKVSNIMNRVIYLETIAAVPGKNEFTNLTAQVYFLG
jgi:hypothetical protein